MSSLNVSLKRFIASPSPVTHAQRAVATLQGQQLRKLSEQASLYAHQTYQLKGKHDYRFAKNAALTVKSFANFNAQSSLLTVAPFNGRKSDFIVSGACLGLLMAIAPIRHTVVATLVGAASGVSPTLGALFLTFCAASFGSVLFEEAVLFLVGTGKEHAGRTLDTARGLLDSCVRPEPSLGKQAGLLGVVFELIPVAIAHKLEQKGYSAMATASLIGASVNHIGLEISRGAAAIAAVGVRVVLLGLTLVVLEPIALSFLLMLLTLDAFRSLAYRPRTMTQNSAAA